MIEHLCPCCGRHCYLDEPQCERGVIYKETGEIPPRKPKAGANGETRKLPEKKLKYLALNRDEKIIWNIQEIGMNAVEIETSIELLDCLRENDRATLLLLLEKVAHGLHHKK